MLKCSSVLIYQRHQSAYLINEICDTISKINPEFMCSYFIYIELSGNLRKFIGSSSKYYEKNSAFIKSSMLLLEIKIKLRSQKKY